MSRITKRKHVFLSQLYDAFSLPKENQKIVTIRRNKGNNLVEAEDENGDQFLVSIPRKYRCNVWIKWGDFVVIDPIEEGDKVKGEIVKILSKEDIKYFTEENVWPERFVKEEEKKRIESEESSSSEDSGSDDGEEEEEEEVDSDECSDSKKYSSDECEIVEKTESIKVKWLYSV